MLRILIDTRIWKINLMFQWTVQLSVDYKFLLLVRLSAKLCWHLEDMRRKYLAKWNISFAEMYMTSL